MHALYPIRGDPPTWGHADIVRRAAGFCSQLTWAVAADPIKPCCCPPETRLAMVEIYLRQLALPNVSAALFHGTTVRYAQRIGAQLIVRGLRHSEDFRVEQQLAFGNHTIAPELETLWLCSRPEHAFVSASLVRELVLLGEDATHFAPPEVTDRLRDCLQEKPSAS